MRVSQKLVGTFCEGLKSREYSILQSMLGSPYFGKLPYFAIQLCRACKGMALVSLQASALSCLAVYSMFFGG